MNTTQTTSTPAHTYKVDVVATNGTWHRLTVESPSHVGVKAAARKIAKAQGIEVKFINGLFLA